MSAFAAAAAGPLTAEPDKRVHYTLGLVLGVDEFQQEQFYHLSGRRWHNRLLHGYGTVHGLAVSTPEPGTPDPEIQVSPGVAVDPCGREICVPDTMCVRLDGWLDRHRSTLETLYPGGVDTLPLAVVLCYRECETDMVPIPGEPCRTQEDAMQASRLRDSFELRLALREEGLFGSPPGENGTGLHLYDHDHAEEAAVRAFGDLLAGIETVSVAAPGSGRAELLAAVRALAELQDDLASPPASPPESIVLGENEAQDAFREAFRVWVTEVRPALRAREPGGGACGAADEECCVLLAEIDMPVTAGWAVGGVAFEPREETRPILLHSRLLQEWLGPSTAGSGNDDTFATLEPLTGDTIRAWLHYPMPLELEPEDVLISVNAGAADSPAAVAAVAGADNVFDVQLAAGPADGATVELRFDLTTIQVLDSPVESLAEALHSEHGGLLDRYGPEVRAYTVFRTPPDALADYSGDLAGTHPDATVVGIQGNPVSDADPEEGDVLTWADGEWVPAAPETGEAPPLPPAEGDVSGTYPTLEVTGLRGNPVGAAEPALNQYLRWNGSAWVPAHVGGFVIAAGGRYSVVAAGQFRLGAAGQIDPVEPVYHGATVEFVDQPPPDEESVEYLIHFDGYTPPDQGGHMYVVQAEVHSTTGRAASLCFVEFEEAGIRMIRRLEREDRRRVARLFIEISRIN